MPKDGAANVTSPTPRRRSCEACNVYTAHMSHARLVYQFHNDAKGTYHRHFVSCPHDAVETDKLKIN